MEFKSANYEKSFSKKKIVEEESCREMRRLINGRNFTLKRFFYNKKNSNLRNKLALFQD